MRVCKHQVICKCMTDKSIAPELVRTQEKYGTAVDIYAFGMVLLEMIGREQPWSECETHGCISAMQRSQVQRVFCH